MPFWSTAKNNNTDVSEIIEQLKPLVGEPNFPLLLDKLTPDFSKTQRFLIKMELTRLAKICTRIIDQREKIHGTTSTIQHNGITHYLTEQSLTVFKQQVELYGDYTIGVYEAVDMQLSEEKLVNQQSATIRNVHYDTKDNFKAPAIKFDDFIQRCEERMNFFVELELVAELQDEIPALSLDISINGLRAKVSNDYQFKTGRNLFVLFRGLAKEFSMGSLKCAVLDSRDRSVQRSPETIARKK